MEDDTNADSDATNDVDCTVGNNNDGSNKFDTSGGSDTSEDGVWRMKDEDGDDRRRRKTTGNNLIRKIEMLVVVRTCIPEMGIVDDE